MIDNNYLTFYNQEKNMENPTNIQPRIVSICLDSEWSTSDRLITLQLMFNNIIVLYYNTSFF